MVGEVEFWVMSFMNVSSGLFWKIGFCSTAFRSCTISMCNDSNILIQIWVCSFWIWVFPKMDWWKFMENTLCKIHGWFKLGTFTFQPPRNWIGGNSHLHPSVGSSTTRNRTFGAPERTLLPSRGYPESLQYLHLWCVSTFPAKDDVWFSMVRVQRLKRATFIYGRTSRRFHENLMGNIRRNEDLAWRLAKQHTWQPKNKHFLLLGYQCDGEPNLYAWKMDRNHHFHPFFQVVV